jgi:hypothetical protein
MYKRMLAATSGPDATQLLEIDREYREKAAAGVLRRIAPRRFNPEHVAWLSVLHTSTGRWHITALFSNTGRAHELHRTHDWVVIFFDDGVEEGQATVVTEFRGSLAGKRVVRGREAECARHYSALATLGAEPRTDLQPA